MQTHEALSDAFERIRLLVHAVVLNLDAHALTWRPDAQSNSIAWLLWHTSRVQDDHVTEIAGREQVWTSERWAQRFGLPPDYVDTGFGHTAHEVGAIDPDDPQLLVQYHDRVAQQTQRYLRDVDADDFERIIDDSFEPAVTVGVRLVSVVADNLQHTGQAAYVRGLFERRGR